MSGFHTWSGYLQQVENVINALLNHDWLRLGRFGEEKRITFSRQLTRKLEVLGEDRFRNNLHRQDYEQ